jgi:peptidoglycan/LPS O-acetylase OafA/YrhL
LTPLYPLEQQYLVHEFAFRSFPRQLPVFAVGMLCASIVAARDVHRRSVMVLCLAFACLAFLAVLLPARYFLALINSTAIMGVVFGGFALLLAWHPLKLFVNPVTTYLGKISYSMYLTHFAILEAFERLGMTALFPKKAEFSIIHFVLAVVVSAIVSAVFYSAIELKGIAFGKWLIDKLEERAKRGIAAAESAW